MTDEKPKAQIPAKVSESKEGALVQFSGEAASKYTPEDFEAATKVGSFLPRLQLMTANTDKVKSGEFLANHYAIIKNQNYQDLGPEVDCLNLAFRPKALEIGEEVIITVFDVEDSEFARISEKAGEPGLTGAMSGPEYLIYIPSIKEFATLFLGSKTARREAPNIQARITKGMTLKSKKITNKKYTWFSLIAVNCSTPFDLPNQKEMEEQVIKFNNPPKSEIETVSDDDDEKKEEEKRER
jgi:hypothetical protein